MSEEIKAIRIKVGKSYILASANADGKPQTVSVVMVANIPKSSLQVITFKNEKEKVLHTWNYDRSKQTLTIGSEDFTLSKIPSDKVARGPSNVLRKETPNIAKALAAIVAELDGKYLILNPFTDGRGNSFRVAIQPPRAPRKVVDKKKKAK